VGLITWEVPSHGACRGLISDASGDDEIERRTSMATVRLEARALGARSGASRRRTPPQGGSH
jgi:hypothetical protein